MGMWIELGVFLLVFVFAWHQLRDLKKSAPNAKRRATQPKPTPATHQPISPATPTNATRPL